MMKKTWLLAAFAATVGAGALMAQAVSVPQVASIGPNDLIQIIPNGQPVVGNVYAAAPLLTNFSGAPRNYLDNGSLNVQQRGVGIVTCGTTTTAVYGADRWACQANVSSGAGRSSLVTTAALLPQGFTSANQLYRNSGALTQPVCAIQAVPGKESTALAGKTVTLSVYMTALAGLAADNGNVATLSIIYGTSADESIQTPTASPAITPAWTGIGFVVNQKPVTISTTPARYSATGVVPVTATEVGVEICFTPTATGAGTTDGLAWVGAQLEVASNPTVYEFHTVQQDLSKAQRYYYRWTEATLYALAGSQATPLGSCAAVDTTHTNCWLQFPVVLRAAPTMTYTAGFSTPTSTTQATLGACSALASAQTVSGAIMTTTGVLANCTATTIPAAGIASFLYASSGAGVIQASAEF